MEDADESLEVDCNPELGTRPLSTAGPFPLSTKFDHKFVSESLGDRTKGENLLRRRNHSGGTRNDRRRRRTGKRGLCQSGVEVSRNCSENRGQLHYQLPIQRHETVHNRLRSDDQMHPNFFLNRAEDEESFWPLQVYIPDVVVLPRWTTQESCADPERLPRGSRPQ